MGFFSETSTKSDRNSTGEGLEDALREWIETTPDARLIIIDILASRVE